MPFSELLYMVQRIKVSTNIPLSVDLERGYTNNPSELIENIQKLVDIGGEGINLEDAQGEEIYLKKLNIIKNHFEQTNQQLVIDAIADGVVHIVESHLQTTINRDNLYQHAG